ncbi:MAG TPA: hypothetical protein VGY55_21195 [Pirellulales bacterium]|jgi:hypothetical protein|nr:hypothetical protein [Pirellulales bacterium]
MSRRCGLAPLYDVASQVIGTVTPLQFAMNSFYDPAGQQYPMQIPLGFIYSMYALSRNLGR